MISSLEGRVKTMSEFEKSIKNLPNEIIKNNYEAIKNDEKNIQIFLQKIGEEKLEKITDYKHIEKRNWKFPSLISARNKNYYNWQELYKIAKIPPNFSKAIQQHFSEFTHGLGLTILYTDDKIKPKLSIIGILSIIQSLIGKIIMNEYSMEIQELNLNKNFVHNSNYNWKNWM